jgi:hypothetical protein
MLVAAIGGGDDSWADFPAYLMGSLMGVVLATVA